MMIFLLVYAVAVTILAACALEAAGYWKQEAQAAEETEAQGIVREVEQWLADDVGELAAYWPDMPDVTGGVDRFSQHGIVGEP